MSFPFKISRKIVIFVIIPVLVATGLVVFALNKEEASPYQLASAQTGDLVYEVEVTGTVKKAEEFELRFKNSAKVSGVYAKVNDEVKAGKLLMEQENNDLLSQIIEARAALELAKAQLTQAQNPYSPQQVLIAQTEYENAVQNLEDVKTKAELDLAQDIDNALDTLDTAKSKMDKALLSTVKDMNDDYFYRLDQTGLLVDGLEQEARKVYLGDSTFNLVGAVDYYSQAKADPTEAKIIRALDKMYEAAGKIRSALLATRDAMNDGWYGVSSTDKTTTDTEITTVNTELANLTTAKQNISSQKTTNTNNINTAEATVKNKLNEWELKKAGAHQPDITVAEAKVTQAQATLTALQNKYRDAQITAPVNGIITEVNIKKGETAQANEIVIKMIGLSENEIEANVSEVDIAYLQVGNPVKITLDAFPYGESWEGNVVKIDPAQTVIEDVVYYKATVNFAAQDERIKPGMTANLTIVANQKQNVLIIPQRAVIEKNNQSFVRIPESESYIERSVVLGMRGSDGNVEVVSGLSEGEQVITFIKNGN